MPLGLPMVQAHRGESLAPPVGVYIDESARALCDQGETRFRFIWWDWFSGAEPPPGTEKLRGMLGEYFDWCERYTNTTGYSVESICRHQKLAEEYFNRQRRTPITGKDADAGLSAD